MDMIYQFNKLKPPKFKGGANPLRYEEWMQKFENLFLRWPWLLTSSKEKLNFGERQSNQEEMNPDRPQVYGCCSVDQVSSHRDLCSDS